MKSIFKVEYHFQNLKLDFETQCSGSAWLIEDKTDKFKFSISIYSLICNRILLPDEGGIFQIATRTLELDENCKLFYEKNRLAFYKSKFFNKEKELE